MYGFASGRWNDLDASGALVADRIRIIEPRSDEEP